MDNFTGAVEPVLDVTLISLHVIIDQCCGSIFKVTRLSPHTAARILVNGTQDQSIVYSRYTRFPHDRLNDLQVTTDRCVSNVVHVMWKKRYRCLYNTHIIQPMYTYGDMRA
jgi:hypothetical protein